VAAETDIGAVSRLFYVHLLSALQRGQNVEVPRFGTFGTRIAGVKKIRKIPYFESAPELTGKANQRFRDLKYLLIGTYQQIPAFGEAEFTGKVPPYDPLVDTIGKERILDTRNEVTPQEYEQLASETERPQQKQEGMAMPRLNLRDEGMEGEPVVQESGKETGAPPTLREVGGGGGGLSPLVMALLALIVLGAGVFALNYFKVIHLWGKRAAQVTEAISEPAIPAPETTVPGTTTEPGGTPSTTAGQAATPSPATTEPSPAVTEPAAATPTPAATTPTPAAPPEKHVRPAPSVSAPPSGTGGFTVQVSSWASRAKAEKEVGRLSSSGFEAFVEDGVVGGETWHRVRVGRYSTQKEAQEAVAKLQPVTESDLWVARIGH
jgi:cell division protein FtsN